MRLTRVVGTTLVILFWSLAARAADVPLPPGLKIVAPDSSIPADVAGFSGKWVGEWSSQTPHVLVVRQIHPADPNSQYPAEVIYAWGANLNQQLLEGGFSRIKGVIKDGQLVVPLTRGEATYRLSGDRRALEGQWHGKTLRGGGTLSMSGTFRKDAE